MLFLQRLERSRFTGFLGRRRWSENVPENPPKKRDKDWIKGTGGAVLLVLIRSDSTVRKTRDKQQTQ